MEEAKTKQKIIPMVGIRKLIADRMKLSLEVNAQLTHSVNVDMSQAVLLRETLKSKGIRVSYNDVILAATVRALRKFPIMNSEIISEGILIKEYINIGFAVSLNEGLIVPNIKDAHLLDLVEIAERSADLAARAKAGILRQDEYRNGTFTVSNLGMLGLDSFQAIINAPESGILAVGKIADTPVVRDDNITIRPIMTITLSYDHRIVDGEPAAKFILTIKQLLEEPYCLLSRV